MLFKLTTSGASVTGPIAFDVINGVVWQITRNFKGVVQNKNSFLVHSQKPDEFAGKAVCLFLSKKT